MAKPTFLIVGAVKAGTTSLHEYLQMHPEVYMSPVKETNHFSDADMLFTHFNVDYKQDINVNLDKYLAGDMETKIHIAHVRSAEQYAQLFRKAGHARAIGEVSNSYLWAPSTAQAIKLALPEVKIVMILRNPVERLYSQFLMNLKLGKIAERDLMKEIGADQAKPVKGWGVSHLYLEVGNYYAQVKRYYDLFPAEQIKVILYDDFRKDAGAVLRDLFSFLGVDPDFKPDLSKRFNEAGMPRFGKLNYFMTRIGIYGLIKRLFSSGVKEKMKQVLYTRKSIPTITQEEKNRLINYYREDVEKLSALLHRDLSAWLQ